MSDTLNKFIIFAAGFAAGAIVTRIIINRYEKQSYETEYEDEPNDELVDVCEATDEPKVVEKTNNGPTMEEYAAELRKNKYIIDYSNISSVEDEKKIETDKCEEEIEEYEPSIIAPEELGELEDYEVVSLIYYADEVLTDDMNEPVDDADKLIGHDALNHFGEYDDDSVCVRNDMLKCDYEILLDTRRYSDIIKPPRPNQVEE